MRKGFSDARIVATDFTAAHNMMLIELEFAPRSVGLQLWGAAFEIAADLTQVCRQHAAERSCGDRRW
jgi:hypothetical protein